MIDLSEYYSGGYFLIRANKPDWPQLQTDLLPEKLISLSRCICPRLQVYWGWTPGDRDAAVKFGILDAKFDEFAEWAQTTLNDEMDFPSLFFSPEIARRFVKRFLADTSDLYLIGVGLHQSEIAAWDEVAPIMFGEVIVQVNLLLQKQTDYGTEGQIDRRQSLETGGTALGFEVASFAYHDFGHSWYCNHPAEDLGTLFDLRPGQFGLIETREGAEQVYKWVAEAPGSRGEPEPYAYWLLVSYPLTN